MYDGALNIIICFLYMDQQVQIMYDEGLFIGRFQPFHSGHMYAVKHILDQVHHLLLGIGSSNRAMERDNPFTAQERKLMIQKSLNPQQQNRITIHFIPDVQNHIRWITLIEKTLPQFDIVFTNDDITCRLYTQKSIPVRNIPLLDRRHVSGTNIRRLISAGEAWHHHVPAGTVAIVEPIQYRLNGNITDYK